MARDAHLSLFPHAGIQENEKERCGSCVFFLLSVGAQPEPRNYVLIGRDAQHNGVCDAIVFGANAKPTSSNHSFALSIHPDSVSAQSLGVTLNGKSCFIPRHSTRFTSISGSGTTALTPHSSPTQVFRNTHDVVLPPASTLQPGDEFRIISLDGNVVVSGSHGNLIARLYAGSAATFIYAGLNDWIILGLWPAMEK